LGEFQIIWNDGPDHCIHYYSNDYIKSLHHRKTRRINEKSEPTMWYAIISEDVENSLEKRKSARPAHVQRLQDLANAGKLLTAGPHPAIDNEDPGEAGFTGSLIIAEFDSLEDAQSWADADPYINAGVYKQVTIKPFNKVLP
jgi:uncharacterized protein YciI